MEGWEAGAVRWEKRDIEAGSGEAEDEAEDEAEAEDG